MKNQFKIFFFFCQFTLLLSCSNAQIQNNSPKEAPQINFLTIEEDTLKYPIYVSYNNGETWKATSEGLPLGLQGSFLDTINNQLLLATDNAGLFIQSDNNNWKNISKDLPNAKINALKVIDKTIYVGVYQGGIFKSIDKGNSWQSLNYNLKDKRVQAISIEKTHFVLGTDSGIFILKNNAKKWEHVFKDAQVVSINSTNDKLIAGTSKGTILSNDKGQTWKYIHKKGALHNTYVFKGQIIEMYVSGDVFISKDWGTTWVEIQYFPRKGSYIYESIFSKNRWLMANNYGVFNVNTTSNQAQIVFENETAIFFDFIIWKDAIYGTTRHWDEFRKKSFPSISK